MSSLMNVIVGRIGCSTIHGDPPPGEEASCSSERSCNAVNHASSHQLIGRSRIVKISKQEQELRPPEFEV